MLMNFSEWNLFSYVFRSFGNMRMMLLVDCHFVALVLVDYVMIGSLVIDVCFNLHHFFWFGGLFMVLLYHLLRRLVLGYWIGNLSYH